MNRSKWGLWTRRGVVLGLLGATASIGCSPLNLIAFLIARDEVQTAQYPLTFPKDGPKKDKDEVVVLLLPHITPGTSPDYITADRDLAERLAKVLPDLAKENKDKKKMRVISPTQVDKFKIKNPNWRRMDAGTIGGNLEADFVLEIELTQVQLYQPNMPASERIYEGHADVSVNIYEVGKTDGTLQNHYTFTFSYPRGVGMTRPAANVSLNEFKQQYIENLATEIAHRHVDHKTSNTFGSGTKQ
jgi:hypothetical protein